MRLPRNGSTLIELLVVFAVTAILLGLLLPAIQIVRQTALKTQCKSQLRQLAIGLHLYQEEFGYFPLGHTKHCAGADYPSMNWHTRLLPMVEQTNVWLEAVEAYKTERSPFGLIGITPAHRGLQHKISLFQCPADATYGLPPQWAVPAENVVAFTNYLGNLGTNADLQDGVLTAEFPVRALDLVDGLSQTLAVGERPTSFDFMYSWWYAGAGFDGIGTGDGILGINEVAPRTGQFSACTAFTNKLRPDRVKNPCQVLHYWSLHAEGAHFALADGSVRFQPYSAADILSRMATRNAGEPIDEQP
jgi:type II secretory pathway pseudopilin PulG